ncbi:MAG: hypothetical protein FWD06_11120 [Oscillospiraceae bacterium]|nr:hypothetical protein [Oscillospiraceae bacterium]
MMEYRVYDYGDKLEPGQTIKLERSLYLQNAPTELSQLVDLPIKEIQALREKSVAAEQQVFDGLRQAATAWATHAAQTAQLDLALEFVKTPQVQHTANEWVTDSYGNKNISNMVYNMRYQVYEDTRYDRATQTSVPVAWYASWYLHTNAPRQSEYASNHNAKIAGQDRKRFTSKADMEKYLAGRVKAYAHLFTEISPPIPKEYERHFRVNGQLLPGYTLEGERKPTLKEALKAGAERSKTEFAAPRKSVETEAR